MHRKLTFLATAYLLTVTGVYAATEPAARPVFDENGVSHVPSFELPPSEYMSPEARAMLKMRAKMPPMPRTMEPDVEKSRKRLASMLTGRVAGALKLHPVDIVEGKINGVPARIITPKGKDFDPDRILINLHGGAFQTCWESCSILESAPISALGGYKVVSVNYRMAPEFSHPAAVEDVAKVYTELLKSYDAKKIGIYGCSAGGALTAQTAAWLPAHKLPQAGAVGIFGAGGVPFNAGDSAYIAGYVDGSLPPPAKPGEVQIDSTRGYFAGADMSDAVISPALHPQVLKKFPPALIITGTRAMDMSPAVVTNSRLIKAGVRSTLIVGEGMGHCYINAAQLPEAQDAYAAIVSFFEENLR